MLRRQRLHDLQQPNNANPDQVSTDLPSANRDTEKVLAAIHACQTTPTTRIEEIKVDISLLRQDVQRTRERVTAVENRVSMLEGQATPLTMCWKRSEALLNYTNI